MIPYARVPPPTRLRCVGAFFLMKNCNPKEIKTQTMFHVKHYLFAFVSFCIRLSMSAAVLCHRILWQHQLFCILLLSFSNKGSCCFHSCLRVSLKWSVAFLARYSFPVFLYWTYLSAFSFQVFSFRDFFPIFLPGLFFTKFLSRFLLPDLFLPFPLSYYFFTSVSR